MRLRDKVAIVTGGGQGLGFGIARAFADEGAQLVLVGRVQEKLDRAGAALARPGIEVVTAAGDVGVRATAATTVERALARFGRLDIVVNNAQTIIDHCPAERQDDAQLEGTIRSGLFGTIYFMQEAYPALSSQGGAIINMGSMVGVEGYAGALDYAAAKEGIRGASRVAAREWGKVGIRVNVLCPGAKSEKFLSMFEDHPGQLEHYESALALGRSADPYGDIGKLAVFLAGPDCFLTGQTIHADGGKIMP